ncbi:MAG: PaaI family thioesterase [Caldisericia bacterium]
MDKNYTGTDSNCFACGEHNKDGLHLKFATLTDSVEALMSQKKHQGWDDIIHGGIISTMLDEAMSHAIFRHRDATVVTAEMTVRFVAPLRVGRNIKITGKIVSERGRVIETEAEIIDLDDSNTVAKSKGRFVMITLPQEMPELR